MIQLRIEERMRGRGSGDAPSVQNCGDGLCDSFDPRMNK